MTAIVPHGGNVFQDKVAGAVFVGNAFGKLAGSTQVTELGTIETPIVLTNTLSVGTAMDAVVRYTLAQPGNEQVRSVNALVGETNDGGLNDIRGLHVTRDHVTERSGARRRAGRRGGGWRGDGHHLLRVEGRHRHIVSELNSSGAGHTVGVLAQTNFGGNLTIAGVPIFRLLQPPEQARERGASADGSCMLVVATDAPLDARDLGRLAARAVFGLGAHRIGLQQRQRRLRDRLLDVRGDAQPLQRDRPARATRSCQPTRHRRCSKPRSRRPRRPSTTRCSRRRRSGPRAEPPRPFPSTRSGIS